MEKFAELMNAITNSDRFSSIPKIAKERGEKAVYTLMFDAAEARGEARGIAKGEIRGAIKEAIKIYYEDFHASPKEILRKIMDRFSLEEKDAKTYVEETLGVTLESSAPTLAESATAFETGKEES